MSDIEDIMRKMARARAFSTSPDLANECMRLCEIIVNQEARIAALENQLQKTNVGQDSDGAMASTPI